MIFGSERVFIRGKIAEHGVIGTVLSDPALERDDQPHSILAIHDHDGWEPIDIRPWPTTGFATLRDGGPKFCALASHGVLCRFAKGHATDEAVFINSGQAPLMGLGTIADTLFAVGLDYQVYRRVAPSNWIDMSVRIRKLGGDSVGFNAIAGFSVDDLYAVGWNGEIWYFNGRTWTNEHSPTNFILNSVVCTSRGRVYVCGRHGTLLRGRSGRWELVDLEDFDEDLWSMVEYRDAIYAASMDMLIRIAGDEVEVVDVADIIGDDDEDELGLSFGQLSVAGDTLCSIGEIDVLLFDGTDWTRVPTE